MTNEQLFIIILVILNFFSFVLGFIVGKIWSISGVINSVEKPKSFLKESKTNQLSANIDERIIITDIKTDNMVKKYDTLGETKQSTENISSSVNKLKQMKG
jgi:MFS superfamily sulfate permease-like transporter